MSVDKRLYKYLPFGERVLTQLCCDQVYFASPANFNDPLDCQPVIKADIPINQLKQLAAELIRQRAHTELDEALRKVRFRGEKAEARRQALSQSEVDTVLGDLDYNATNPDIVDRQWWLEAALRRLIESEMRKGYERGVFCVSRKFDSPLMWSHYANQHRGLCVEYDASPLKPGNLHKVDYKGRREILASSLFELVVNNNKAVRDSIDKAALLTKSSEWRYENEYRIIGQMGWQESPLNLNGIIFGMLCPEVSKYAVMKSLESRKDVKFWEIVNPEYGFRLKRKLVEDDDLLRAYPRTSMAYEFTDFTDEDPA